MSPISVSINRINSSYFDILLDLIISSKFSRAFPRSIFYNLFLLVGPQIIESHNTQLLSRGVAPFILHDSSGRAVAQEKSYCRISDITSVPKSSLQQRSLNRGTQYQLLADEKSLFCQVSIVSSNFRKHLPHIV
jgi:hypothetical protein